MAFCHPYRRFSGSYYGFRRSYRALGHSSHRGNDAYRFVCDRYRLDRDAYRHFCHKTGTFRGSYDGGKHFYRLFDHSYPVG